MVLRLFLALFLLTNIAYAQCCCCTSSRVVLAGWWGGADYLLIWRKGRPLPPLITTSSDADEGILGNPTTQILFGGEKWEDSPKSGVRGSLGLWLFRCLGIGADFWIVNQEEEEFSATSTGEPLLARPFFQVNPVAGPSSLVISNNLLGGPRGSVFAKTENKIYGGDILFRYSFLNGCTFTIDGLAGYVYARMDDEVKIGQSYTLGGTFFEGEDEFKAENSFNGGGIGINAAWSCGCFTLNVEGLLGIGAMREKVIISGETIITGLGVSISNGNLLALPTNIGTFTRTHFVVLPEIDISLRYYIFENLFLSVGYTLIYFPEVVLAGEQIDLNINTTQLNGGVLVGPRDPRFRFEDSIFWAQGLTVGVSIDF